MPSPILCSISIKTDWFIKLKSTGKDIPTIKEVAMGPFLRTALDNGTYADDILGVNETFLDALFSIMPGVVGNNVWKGIHRCTRNPAYSTGSVQVGKMTEMVTRSDEAFVIWCFENFFDSVMKDVEDHFAEASNQRERRLQGKYTKQGTKKYTGWPNDGKIRWNDLVRESTQRWNRQKPESVLHENWPRHMFEKMFEREWILKVHKPSNESMRLDNETEEAEHCVISSFEEV